MILNFESCRINNGSFVGSDWIFLWDDDYTCFGIKINRKDTLDKTILRKIKKKLKQLKIPARIDHYVVRDTSLLKAGSFYKLASVGSVMISVKGELPDSIMRFHESGNILEKDL